MTQYILKCASCGLHWVIWESASNCRFHQHHLTVRLPLPGIDPGFQFYLAKKLSSWQMKIKDRDDPSEQSSIIHRTKCCRNCKGQESRKLTTRLMGQCWGNGLIGTVIPSHANSWTWLSDGLLLNKCRVNLVVLSGDQLTHGPLWSANRNFVSRRNNYPVAYTLIWELIEKNNIKT